MLTSHGTCPPPGPRSWRTFGPRRRWRQSSLPWLPRSVVPQARRCRGEHARGQEINLVAGDTNGTTDVFVRDRQAGTTIRISVNSDAVQGDAASRDPALSADGHLVAFGSDATNLVPGDTNGVTDVFAHDLQTGATTRASVNESGAEADAFSAVPDLDAAGEAVTFVSPASNLVPGDTNGVNDVFVRTLGPTDDTPPTVVGMPDRQPNPASWYRDAVTVTWTATDPEPSSGTPTTPAPTVATAEGRDIIYTSEPSCDPAGNCATGSYTLSLDATPPSVSVTGPQDGHSYLQGQTPDPGCATTDALSGVADQANLTLTDDGNGHYTATCSGASDLAGNTAATVSISYTVVAPVRGVATNTRSASGNNAITVTVGAGGIAAGDTVTVSVSTGTFAGAVGCSDSNGNSYTVDVDRRNSGNGRVFVCSTRLLSALSPGDVVTATYPGFNGISLVSVNAISTLASSGVVDATASAAGNNANPNSGNTPTTTSADAVLFGVVTHHSTPTFNPGTGYAVVGAVSSGAGSGRRTISPEFQLVSQTGSYAATGTLSSRQLWQAAIVAYNGP
jgi:hypothetical protein